MADKPLQQCALVQPLVLFLVQPLVLFHSTTDLVSCMYYQSKGVYYDIHSPGSQQCRPSQGQGQGALLCAAPPPPPPPPRTALRRQQPI